jgi:chromosome segregation ATPase
MPDTKNITEERAARRFHQIAVLQRQLYLKRSEMTQCKQHYKDLGEEAEGLLARIMTAARDEGELPLFDLDE